MEKSNNTFYRQTAASTLMGLGAAGVLSSAFFAAKGDILGLVMIPAASLAWSGYKLLRDARENGPHPQE